VHRELTRGGGPCRLKAIRADDRMIRAEGLKALSYDELQSACQQRGLRWDGETKFSMRRQVGGQ
jgi:LETM1 and EF-hand domain-containing protein 1